MSVTFTAAVYEVAVRRAAVNQTLIVRPCRGASTSMVVVEVEERPDRYANYSVPRVNTRPKIVQIGICI